MQEVSFLRIYVLKSSTGLRFRLLLCILTTFSSIFDIVWKLARRIAPNGPNSDNYSAFFFALAPFWKLQVQIFVRDWLDQYLGSFFSAFLDPKRQLKMINSSSPRPTHRQDSNCIPRRSLFDEDLRRSMRKLRRWLLDVKLENAIFSTSTVREEGYESFKNLTNSTRTIQYSTSAAHLGREKDKAHRISHQLFLLGMFDTTKARPNSIRWRLLYFAFECLKLSRQSGWVHVVS